MNPTELPETAESPEPLTTLIERLTLSDATSEPYYLQLKRQLNALMESGDLASGYNLPSERVLAEALQVSRTTVKRCYDELRNSQQLSSNGRGGTVVQVPQIGRASCRERV